MTKKEKRIICKQLKLLLRLKKHPMECERASAAWPSVYGLAIALGMTEEEIAETIKEIKL